MIVPFYSRSRDNESFPVIELRPDFDTVDIFESHVTQPDHCTIN